MKILSDFLPIVLFFLVFKVAGIYAATATAMAATVGQIGWTWWRTRHIPPMQWISLALILVFGGATLFLHNPMFIKWKPTILYWLFAIVLLGARIFLRKNLIRELLAAQMQLPESVWVRLNAVWALFFTVMGGLNLWVAYQFSEATWVNFKLFGGMGLMFAFVLAQGYVLNKYLETPRG